MGKQVKEFIFFGNEAGVLFQYETSSGIIWKTSGNGNVQPKYEGEIKNGKMDGLGVLTYPYGEKSVVGEWKEGKEWNTKHKDKNGTIIKEYENGKLFVKREPRQLKPCKVSITLPDGNLFEGNFVDEKLDEQINGVGTLTYLSGRNYSGEWKNGVFHGQGTYTSPDVSTYVGEWKDGERHGQGTLTWSGGDKYVGEWKEDKWWEGIEYDKNGKFKCKFVNGEPIKE